MSDGMFATPAISSLSLVLDDAALRQQAISSNLANVNTPGYQRMDVSTSFSNALNSALDRLSEGQSASEMPTGRIEVAASQNPARPDGNTVQMEQEMISMANNSARYEFAGQMIGLNFHGMKLAITGQE